MAGASWQTLRGGANTHNRARHAFHCQGELWIQQGQLACQEEEDGHKHVGRCRHPAAQAKPCAPARRRTTQGAGGVAAGLRTPMHRPDASGSAMQAAGWRSIGVRKSNRRAATERRGRGLRGRRRSLAPQTQQQVLVEHGCKLLAGRGAPGARLWRRPPPRAVRHGPGSLGELRSPIHVEIPAERLLASAPGAA